MKKKENIMVSEKVNWMSIKDAVYSLPAKIKHKVAGSFGYGQNMNSASFKFPKIPRSAQVTCYTKPCN